MEKHVKMSKKMILTSKRCAEHRFAGKKFTTDISISALYKTQINSTFGLSLVSTITRLVLFIFFPSKIGLEKKRKQKAKKSLES